MTEMTIQERKDYAAKWNGCEPGCPDRAGGDHLEYCTKDQEDTVAPFEYPTYDYASDTPERNAARAARLAHDTALEDLKKAQKAARRSPAKWQPVVARLDALVDALAADVEEKNAAEQAVYEAHREAREATLKAAATWALEQIGPTFETENKRPALRVAIAGNDEVDLIAWSDNRVNFEVAFVAKGTIEVQRYGPTAYVTGPDEKWHTVSGETTIDTAKIRWSSASQMEVADAEGALRVYDLAVRIAENINKAFGL